MTMLRLDYCGLMLEKDAGHLPVTPQHGGPLLSAHAAQSCLKVRSDLGSLPGVVMLLCTTGSTSKIKRLGQTPLQLWCRPHAWHGAGCWRPVTC